MIKNYLLILLLFSPFYSSQAQNINLSEEEIIKTLCHTWSLSFASIKGKPIQIDLDFKVQFNSDYSYFLLSNPENPGKWMYNKQGKYIELRTNNRIARITSLNKKELIFIEMDIDEYQRATPQNSQFHFIRNE